MDDDSRVNLFEEKRNDVIQATSRDPLEVSVGPMTRFRVKIFKEALNGLFQDIQVKMYFKKILNNEE